MTHAEFSMQAAYLASRSAIWAGECVMMPELLTEPMRDYSIKRFVKMLRDTADMIERSHVEAINDKEGET